MKFLHKGSAKATSIWVPGRGEAFIFENVYFHLSCFLQMRVRLKPETFSTQFLILKLDRF